MTDNTIPQHYVEGFRANLNMVPQQKTARLLRAVDADMAYAEPGTSFNCDDVGIDTPQRRTTRFGDSPEGVLENIRRGGHFDAYESGKFIDSVDKARFLQDPSNKTMAAMMAGRQRFIDDKIIDTLFGTTYGADAGGHLTVALTFPSSQNLAANSRANLHAAEANVVAASGDLGLTIGKLITAGEMLDRSELEGERYFAWGSKQKSQLLASAAATNSDYAAAKALVNGEIDTFMGFTFIRTERLPIASSIRSCAAWIKPAIEYRAREVTTARITERSDKSYNWYAYYAAEHAGARRYDTGVVRVLCAE